MSFGQEIGVNALQLARAFAAIANGGILPTPYLVAEVSRPGSAPERRTPPAGPRVISERTAAAMRRLLVKVVEDGTGRKAAVPGFTVAGKTGTAQKAIPGAGYSSDRYVGSFYGFLPADRPRVVIGVVVDEPHGKTYGGDVAAPVFAVIGRRDDAHPRRAGPSRGGPRDAVDPDGRPLARGRSARRARCRPGSFRRPFGRRRSPRTSTSSPRARGSSPTWPAVPPARPSRSWRSAASP